MSIFKACDIRGIVGEQWGAEEALRIGGSLGSMLRARHQSDIVVGGDFRRSTPELKVALVRGLRREGITVRDVGQVPTPVVQYAARVAECRNLAVVTASHNPGKYNGIKFIVDGWPPTPPLIEELQKGCGAGVDSERLAPRESWDVVSEYERWIVPAAASLVTNSLARRTSPCPAQASADESPRQRVVVDTMGGAFTHLAPRVLRSAGYDVISIDDNLDADFARRDPNPAVDANLQKLVETLRRQTASLGFALDGDGDRVIFVDQQGTIARPEQMAAILIKYCLGRCDVVYDLKCASVVPRCVAEQGGTAIRQPSGHGFIKRKLLEIQAELGIEVSGHHFFGALQGGDDGLFTALVILRLLHATRTSLADCLRAIGWPAITPDLRIPFQGDPQYAIESIARSCGGNVCRMDGVRADYGSDAWALGAGRSPSRSLRSASKRSNVKSGKLSLAVFWRVFLNCANVSWRNCDGIASAAADRNVPYAGRPRTRSGDTRRR